MRARTAAILAMSAQYMLAADYRLAPAKGIYLRLTVEKTGLLRGKKHVFEFSRYRGAVAYDPTSPLTTDVRFTIESASIRCLDNWVSEKDRVKIQHVAEHDMLAVDIFPDLGFRSTRITAVAANRFLVHGLLTIRNVAKPVDVDVSLRTDEGNTVWADGQASVKLTDYGLKPPTAALGTIGTKDEMTLMFRMKLTVPEGRAKGDSPKAALAIPGYSRPYARAA